MPPEKDANPPVADVGVVVLAAGSGSRMGEDKTLMSLAGKPVIVHSLETFQRTDRVDSIVVVVSQENREAVGRLASEHGIGKVIDLVEGGERRQDSTANGVERLAKDGRSALKWVMIHDGARPFVDEEMIERGLESATKWGAAAPALPVTDTIRAAGKNGGYKTLDRSKLRAIQTPQVFDIDVLLPALRTPENVTDDVALVELSGGRISLFDGDPDNLKLTTPSDLEIGERIAARRSGAPMDKGTRWGTGFDGHALAAGGPLRLGGVDVEFDHHLEGHSDGDVLLHAITSALLGGAGLGDLGSNFPSSDSAYAGIDSRELLKRARRLASERGWEPVFLDATIIAQRPKLATYVNRMAVSVAKTLSLPVDSVNIKITSTDHVGAIGKSEGIAAQAVCTLARKSSG